jgi:hypothetical protein
MQPLRDVALAQARGRVRQAAAYPTPACNATHACDNAYQLPSQHRAHPSCAGDAALGPLSRKEKGHYPEPNLTPIPAQEQGPSVGKGGA